MANATPQEFAPMRFQVDAQMSYQLNPTQMLEQSLGQSQREKSRTLPGIPSGNVLNKNQQETTRLGSSFPMSAFESVLKLLQKVAPELYRVHFLRYLNSLYHDDYPGALENLHRYFDYSAGMEGSDFLPTSFGCTSNGRYEIALLSLGMTHFHLGHRNLEVLTEAVHVCQQHSDDICLAYTLTAICSLLSEVDISNMTRVMAASDSHVTSIVTSLSVQQQLFVLLRRSLKRANSLNLKVLRGFQSFRLS